MTARIEIARVGQTQLRVTRRFLAQPESVFRCHFEPTLVRQWMLGPPGWTMPVCQIEAVKGSNIKIQWQKAENESFGMTGKIVEIEPPRRSVHTELFGFPGATESMVETQFHLDGAGTRLELLITYQNQEAREAVLNSGMADGMEASYQRIDELLTRASN